MTIEQIRANWDQVLNSSLVNGYCRIKYRESFPIFLEEGTLTILLRNENIDSAYNGLYLSQLAKSIYNIFNIKVKCESKAFDKILIKEDNLKECIRFVINTLTPNGSEMTKFDFQNQERSARSNGDYFIDVIEGKLAEFAFSDFCGFLHGFTFEIDTKIYKGTTVTDGGNDVQILYYPQGKFLSNLKVDIKSTKVGHQWLLVEKKKVFADVYVLVKLQFENESFLSDIFIDPNQLDSDIYRRKVSEDIFLKFKGKYYAEIAGFALLTDLIDPITNKSWFEFPSNEKLLKTGELKNVVSDSPEKNREIISEYQDVLKGLNVELKAEVNYGLPAYLLRKNIRDWRWLFGKIKQVSIPFDNQIYLNAFQNLINDQEKIDKRVQELKKRRDNF
ncbi:hypothetical protein [Bacillus toyonensis]|uniref:hypothetical protein n=1 Tax=Bacillus toyonensis TaxID=155322 RepID=UPI002E2073E5|nr:hypothetical protein [Bacillus toyonensis]